jgi:hypothetical protein
MTTPATVFATEMQAIRNMLLGLAFDLNPMQNPLRWKKGYEHRKDLPENASYNPAAPGTLYPQHPVVLKFEEKGFRWGHHFKQIMTIIISRNDV